MAKKRRTRRFLITVEIEEVDQKPDQVAHQAPPPIQTRDDQPGWLERQQVPPRRRRRPRTDSEG
ncbi:MAG: hypothetical protein ACOX1P_18370 [Thermoguttaceae bacterium]|jgi:hypothetical protein